MPNGPERLTVLLSFPVPNPESNPYNSLLRDAVEGTGEARCLYFSWRTALTERYDAFHVHWPELLCRGRGPVRAAVKRALLLALLARLRVQRIPLVRTVHNVSPHEVGPRGERFVLRRVEQATTLRIILNDQTPTPAGAEVQLIEHGHYRDWYAVHPEPDSEPGTFGFFGKIRPYKGLEELVQAFRALEDPNVRLRVGGAVSDPDLAGRIRGLAGDDPRIELRLRHLDDADLVDLVGRCELIVLPYADMHNSGVLLAAMSLSRPVLVPENPATRTSVAEFGARWVQTYSGQLSPAILTAALSTVRATPPGSGPDLGSREWGPIGHAHLAAYRRARSAAQRH